MKIPSSLIDKLDEAIQSGSINNTVVTGSQTARDSEKYSGFFTVVEQLISSGSVRTIYT